MAAGCGRPGSDTTDEVSRIDVYVDGEYSRAVKGSAASERFHGTPYADAMFGVDGADEFIGNEGPDLFVGGEGNDRYVFAPGHGADTIEDSGGSADELVLTGGIRERDLTFTEDSGGLNVRIGGPESKDLILIVEWGAFGNVIEKIVVKDNVLHPEDVEARIIGNRRPRVVQPFAGQTAVAGQPFVFEIPAKAFEDPDPGDELRYIEYRAGGELLPDWLRFDPSQGRFWGTPSDTDLDRLEIDVYATDPGNRFAIARLTIDVVESEQFRTID